MVRYRGVGLSVVMVEACEVSMVGFLVCDCAGLRGDIYAAGNKLRRRIVYLG